MTGEVIDTIYWGCEALLSAKTCYDYKVIKKDKFEDMKMAIFIELNKTVYGDGGGTKKKDDDEEFDVKNHRYK